MTANATTATSSENVPIRVGVTPRVAVRTERCRLIDGSGSVREVRLGQGQPAFEPVISKLSSLITVHKGSSAAAVEKAQKAHFTFI
ncbi:hypothetical protein GCM10027456_13370 [Kineosporia babensis]